MKFIGSVFLGIVRSVVIFLIFTIALLSFLQKKFPPTITDPRPILEAYRRILESTSNFDGSLGVIDPIKAEEIITSRAKLYAESLKLDPSYSANSQEKKKQLSFNRDWDSARRRLEHSEYKIKLLEYEVSVLKNEINNLKTEKRK